MGSGIKKGSGQSRRLAFARRKADASMGPCEASRLSADKASQSHPGDPARRSFPLRLILSVSEETSGSPLPARAWLCTLETQISMLHTKLLIYLIMICASPVIKGDMGRQLDTCYQAACFRIETVGPPENQSEEEYVMREAEQMTTVSEKHLRRSILSYIPSILSSADSFSFL